MDVYEFSERDDQNCNQSKSGKNKKRKAKTDSSLSPLDSINSKKSRGRKSKLKLSPNDIQENSEDFFPPIKLKLVRLQNNPLMFKSIQIVTDYTQPSDCCMNFEQQSVDNCKLIDGREFFINDIVWAKIHGYPFWPSKILSINLSNNRPQQKCTHNHQNSLINSIKTTTTNSCCDEYIACVEWLAYDQISYVNCANLSHFLVDFDNKFSAKIKNKKYFEAVHEGKLLSDEKISNLKHYPPSSLDILLSNNRPVDSVHSCETTTEADTSSTLPSHNFTSPESNQSLQSYRPNGVMSDPLSNQSDRSSLGNNSDFPTYSSSESQTNNNIISTINNNNNLSAAQKSSIKIESTTNLSNKVSTSSWELPDLGSNLDFDNGNHIPEFSDSDDDCNNFIDIDRIKCLLETDNI